ncbi:MAG: hypothetical protein H6613_05090 [Ignavibacteriales bacterium]|nr:hypothetical protein [Ignavibacteriales bacterium]
MLEHTTPISVENNLLNIQTTEKEDVTILNESIDFLIKYLNSHYNSKLSLKITFGQLQMTKDEIERDNSPIIAEEIDIPLIEMIKKELGGKEIK